MFLKHLIEKKEVIVEKKKVSKPSKRHEEHIQLQICRLLLTFANSLDPDQAQHNFQSNVEQIMFDTKMVFFFLKKKIRRRQQ